MVKFAMRFYTTLVFDLTTRNRSARERFRYTNEPGIGIGSACEVAVHLELALQDVAHRIHIGQQGDIGAGVTPRSFSPRFIHPIGHFSVLT